MTKSLSLRRAWIEIIRKRRSYWRFQPGRSPYGERGLKYRVAHELRAVSVSLSLRRAWIEIPFYGYGLDVCPMSLSLRRAWIEIPISR